MGLAQLLTQNKQRAKVDGRKAYFIFDMETEVEVESCPKADSSLQKPMSRAFT